MRRSVPGTKTIKNDTPAVANKRRVLLYLCMLVTAGGLLFLLFYYQRQIDFYRIHSLSAPLEAAFRSRQGSWAETVIREPGAGGTTAVRFLTEAGSLTRITIRDRGMLVLYGSCDLVLYPERRRFWSIDRGQAAFFPLREGALPADRLTAEPPVAAELYAGKRQVDQGRTLPLRVVTAATVTNVTGWLGRRYMRFFTAGEAGTERTFAVLQGIDVFDKPGLTRLSLLLRRADGGWITRVYPFRINKRRRFSVFRGSARVEPQQPPKLDRRGQNDFWARWLARKRFVLAENRPQREWKMLQPVYTAVLPELLWRGRFREPLTRYDRISSTFGEVRYLTSGGGSPHRGIDYAAPEGWEVVAPARGRVVWAGMTLVRGGLVIIDHGLGVKSTAMHLSRVLARSNTLVGPGQVIGLVGSTGLSTGPHLHFGINAGNVAVDPAEWHAAPPWPRTTWHLLAFTDEPELFMERE